MPEYILGGSNTIIKILELIDYALAHPFDMGIGLIVFIFSLKRSTPTYPIVQLKPNGPVEHFEPCQPFIITTKNEQSYEFRTLTN